MSSIENTIEEFLKVNLPDFNLPVALEASGNLVQGQLTSDVLIRYAKKVKKSPDQISAMLFKLLPDFGNDYRVVLDSGYLNVFINKFSPDQLEKFRMIPASRIFFPLSAAGRGDNSFLRLLSVAITQLLFSNGKTKLTVFSDRILGEFSEITADLLQLKPESPNASVRDIFIKLLQADPAAGRSPITLWLSPEQLSKADISKIYQSGSATDNLQIQIPHASWLKDLDQEIISKYRTSTDPLELLKLNLLLSGAEPSTDMFYEEAVLPQRNNLVWYLQTTQTRLLKLAVQPKEWSLSLEFTDLPESINSLIWSILLLPGYRQKAVVKGLVPDLVSNIYHFLDQLNLFFNSPQLRQKMLRQDCSQLETEILSAGLLLVQELCGSITSASERLVGGQGK